MSVDESQRKSNPVTITGNSMEINADASGCIFTATDDTSISMESCHDTRLSRIT